MDASAIRAVAGHAHTTRGATNTKRRRLAHHAQLGKLTRIAPGYYLDTAAITAHPDPGTVVAIARLTDGGMAVRPAASGSASAPRHDGIEPTPESD